MVFVTGLLLLIILNFVKIGVLIWVFSRTRILATIPYSIYLLSNWFVNLILVNVTDTRRGDAMRRLGTPLDTQVRLLIQFIPTGIEAVLFIWLVVALTKRRSQ